MSLGGVHQFKWYDKETTTEEDWEGDSEEFAATHSGRRWPHIYWTGPERANMNIYSSVRRKNEDKKLENVRKIMWRFCYEMDDDFDPATGVDGRTRFVMSCDEPTCVSPRHMAIVENTKDWHRGEARGWSYAELTGREFDDGESKSWIEQGYGDTFEELSQNGQIALTLLRKVARLFLDRDVQALRVEGELESDDLRGLVLDQTTVFSSIGPGYLPMQEYLEAEMLANTMDGRFVRELELAMQWMMRKPVFTKWADKHIENPDAPSHLGLWGDRLAFALKHKRGEPTLHLAIERTFGTGILLSGSIDLSTAKASGRTGGFVEYV